MSMDETAPRSAPPWINQQVDPSSGSGLTVGGLLRNLEMALEYYESGAGLQPDPGLVARNAVEEVRRATRVGRAQADAWWDAAERDAVEGGREAAAS